MRTKPSFHLEKWFLDLVTERGEAVILYAAQLNWKRWKLPYKSILHCSGTPDAKVSQHARFRRVELPKRSSNQITWKDRQFEIQGIWEGMTTPVEERLHESATGFLDWQCYQPSAKVNLRIKENHYNGLGYAERLVLTAPPWEIPMEDLRWGRFVSEQNHLVWISLGGSSEKRWLWWNGQRIYQCTIDDQEIRIPGENRVIELVHVAELEAEKKIFNVVRDAARYIPGFEKAMPLRFLMADEQKWLSRASFKSDDEILDTGYAIHELVQFIS